MRQPVRLAPGYPHWPLVEGERFVHITNLAESDTYARFDNPIREATLAAGIGTLLGVPLRKDGVYLGVFSLTRVGVRPFSEKEIALLENFAAQAVIAMENARLITETREALEQQTATAEVLGVINASPGDLAPVFEAMLEKALHLCGAAFGILDTYDSQRFHAAAMHGIAEEYAEFRRRTPAKFGPATTLGRLLRGEAIIHVVDAADADAYRSGDPARVALVNIGGCRSLLTVALRQDDVLLGAITIFRLAGPRTPNRTRARRPRCECIGTGSTEEGKINI